MSQMGRQTPEVVTGSRNVAAHGLVALDKSGSESLPGSTIGKNLPEGSVEFRSYSAGLRVQLTDPPDTFNVLTGQKMKANKLALQFRYGSCITADPDCIHRSKGCDRDCELHPGGLKPHPNYGLGYSYWDAADADARVTSFAVSEAAAQIEKNPAVLDALLKKLEQDGFQFPQRTAAPVVNEAAPVAPAPEPVKAEEAVKVDKKVAKQ